MSLIKGLFGRKPSKTGDDASVVVIDALQVVRDYVDDSLADIKKLVGLVGAAFIFLMFVNVVNLTLLVKVLRVLAKGG